MGLKGGDEGDDGEGDYGRGFGGEAGEDSDGGISNLERGGD